MTSVLLKGQREMIASIITVLWLSN